MEVLALSFQLMGSTVICVPVLGMILEKGCPTAWEELWLESQEAWVASRALLPYLYTKGMPPFFTGIL